MRGWLLIVAIASLVALATADAGQLVSVRMKDGRKVVGRIVEKDCTDAELVLRDIRTKRKITIPWTELDPELARKHRIDLGFEVAEAKGGTMIEADQIRNRTGNLFTGLVLNRDTARKDGHYLLKTADGILTIRLADVREEKKVEVDATDVYTPQELYEKKIAGNAPETAEDHYKIGEYARLVGALPQAKQHYEKVLEIGDDKYPPSAIERLIRRVDKLIASEEAVEKLAAIKRHIVYNRFDEAKKELEAFSAEYGRDEDFAKEVESLDAELETKRKEYFTDKVARMLRDAVKDALADKVREEEISIRDAMNYAVAPASAEESASRAAVLKISTELGIEPDEIGDLWKDRPKRGVHKAFYRDGTFIVLEDMEDALAKAPKPKVPKGEKAPKLPKPRPVMTAEKWWEGMRKAKKWSHLRDFLYAYWAEKSGVVDVEPEKWEGCPTCAGKGYVVQSVMTQGGNVIFSDRCPTCHMAKGFRIVRFK